MLRLIKCKCVQLLRERTVMFWALVFPIILGIMFYFALTNLDDPTLEPIKVAVVVEEESEQSRQFQNFVKDASEILDAEIVDETAAMEQLKEGKIDGVYRTGITHELIVTKSSLQTSILQTLLETYQSNEDMVMEIMQNHPENLEKAVIQMGNYQKMTEDVSLRGTAQDSSMPYFLALIGMACMYGCFLGLRSAMDMQANLSPLGARRSVTPTHRLKLVIADMLATFGIHFVNILILVFFLRFVLSVDLGASLGGIILVCAVGSMIGVALGMFVGSFGKLDENIKLGIMLAISMVCSFLAGLMMGNMKDIIERHAPIVNRLNPAALISDAFYSLSIYPDMMRYYRNIFILFGMSIVLVGLSFMRVRRERYDSI